MKRLFLSLSLLVCGAFSFSQIEKYAEVKNQVITNPPKVKVKNSNYLMNFEHAGKLYFVRGISAKSGQSGFSSLSASMNAFTKFIVDEFSKDFKFISSKYVSGVLENDKEGVLTKTDGVLSIKQIGGKILFFPVELNRSDLSMKLSVISYDIETKELSKRKKIFVTKDLYVGLNSHFDLVNNNENVLMSYANKEESKYILVDEQLNITEDTDVRVDKSVNFIKQDAIKGVVNGVYDPSKGEFKETNFVFGAPLPTQLHSMNTEGAGGVGTTQSYSTPIPNIVLAYGDKTGKVDIIGMEYDQNKKTVGPKMIQFDAKTEEVLNTQSNPVLKGYRSIETRGVEIVGEQYVWIGESIGYKETGVAYPSYETIAISGINSDGKVAWTKQIDRYIQENYIVQMADIGFQYLIKDDKVFLFYKSVSGADTKKKLKPSNLDGLYMQVISMDGAAKKIKVFGFEEPNHETMSELKFKGNCFIDEENKAIYFVGIVKKGTSITKVSLK